MSEPTVQTAIAALTRSFREAGLPSPELDARLLVLDVCGLSHEGYLMEPGRPLLSAEAERIAVVRVRRLDRESVSRILGYREFWGRRFSISPAVLDPRPDTETLIEVALNIAKTWNSQRSLNIIDLGTGSGSILLTLLAELPFAFGIGVDRDPAALAIARQNAANLGLGTRAAFVCSNWLDAINGSFQLIVSNPPYIMRGGIDALDLEVRAHDPHLALDGGLDGFDAYRKIVAESRRVAVSGAWVLLEAGIGQAQGIIDLFTEAGWPDAGRNAHIHRDLAGVDRVVAIMRQKA